MQIVGCSSQLFKIFKGPFSFATLQPQKAMDQAVTKVGRIPSTPKGKICQICASQTRVHWRQSCGGIKFTRLLKIDRKLDCI